MGGLSVWEENLVETGSLHEPWPMSTGEGGQMRTLSVPPVCKGRVGREGGGVDVSTATAIILQGSTCA
jgi:hypothetical protein